MLESVLTNTSNVKTRIQTALDEVLPGLMTIYKNCKSKRWDRYKFREFWAAVRNEEDAGEGELRKGNRFGSKVSDLRHFLSVASKKRVRNAFTDDESAAIVDLNNKLKAFSSLCNKASSELSVNNDVSFEQIAAAAAPIIEACKKIRALVTSDKFTESYIEEALFITSKNIDKELYSQIKITLGILNDTKNSFPDLVKMFKDESKKLNKLLSKALRYDSIYYPEQLQHIGMLNETLLELSSNIRINNLNDSYTEKIKSLIKVYVKRCKIVCAFLEKRLGIDPNTKTINESDDVSDTTNQELDSAVKSIPDSTPELDTAVADAAASANTVDTTPVNDTSNVSANAECGDTGCAKNTSDDVTAKFEVFMNMF